MSIPAKKLSAFVKKDAPLPFRPKAKVAEEDEESAKDEPAESEDEGEDTGKDVDEEGEGEEPEIDVGEIARQIKKGNGSPKLMKLSKGITPETNPPKWVQHKAIWQKAKKAVTGEAEPGEAELEETGYDEPYAVISHVYKKMGGGIKE